MGSGRELIRRFLRGRPRSPRPFLLAGLLDNAVVASAAALFLVGAALSIFTSRGAFASGVRMLFIGCAVAAVTYAVGSWLGVQVSG